ncbi:TraR/DksA C4-type zinc finger protein [Streptomyces sp. NPDC006134]|uniref:TraR/DksA C4-type zinc finger protein n=1 Tax=Streptomyces sp. NPDC006134 TaxID=3154467 RepID=UPI0033F50CC4
MSLDASQPESRTGRLTAHEARQRLEHARNTCLTQLHALARTGQAADDRLLAEQKAAVEQALTEIDAAFARVADGTYGRCEGCAKPVPAERLEILPYTRHCVACRRRTA